ncbi:peptidase domain-containing ABC transporter [Ornithinibacillus bavariensis]|uniref:Bacteriocin cleavage/export ABC transporter n=1 Tax=Ornithinibacillus bavariensis TaxID=545502 RepID=A0A919X5S0_9BACI|nr:peptidase domain-containing ABC transporter [Ornithinibacillus bavariensis]GIO25514.1 bacteriocin cleavage/export ABC transporter [Ornithinibacillus bavariensis]
MKKKYFTKQLEENDCGPAAVSMLIKYSWDIEMTLSQLKVILSTNKNGTTFLGIKRGLQKLGVETNVSKCVSSKETFQELKYPCITQIKGSNNHFITLFKATKNHVYIGDPSKNQIKRMKINRFLSNWVPFVLEVEKLIDSQKLTSYSITETKQSNTIIKSLFTIKKYIITSWILSGIVYLLTIYLAGMFSTYFDLIIPNEAVGLIVGVTVIYLLAVTIQFFLKYINSVINVKTNNSIDKNLVEKLVSKYFAQDYTFTEQFESGELITRFSNISDIRTRYLFFIQTLPLDTLAIIVTFIILFRMNVYLSLLTFIPIITFFLLLFFSRERYENLSYNLFEKQEYLNTELIETVDNTESIKNYNITNQMKDKVIKRLDEVYAIREKFISFDNFQNLIKVSVVNFFNVCFFAFGSYLVINDDLSSGMLLMFNSLVSNVFNPFVNLTTLQATLEQGRVATLRYEDIVNSVQKKPDQGIEIENKIEKIVIQNLYFSFTPNNYVLNNLNIEVKQGEKIALIGGSGSGKSTIAKLLAGYYEPEKGDILFNDISISNINQASLLKKVLYIPQDIQIFNDTILNNILLHRDIDFEVVKEVSRLVGFEEVVNSMPEGYNTVIGSKGVQLSMGQQQMLNITRYILSSPDVLILDEITNGLDFVKRNQIKQLLREAPMIVIFITHDLDLATACDKIYALNNGKTSTINPQEDGDIKQKLINSF